MNEFLDSDFILNLTLSEEQSNVIIWGNTENGTTYGTLQLCPNEDDFEMDMNYFICYSTMAPEFFHRYYTFLIDVSGSMCGEKLEHAKRALHLALRNLEEGDVFNIVAFESGFDRFAPRAVEFNQVNLELADKWIDQLEDMGGTEILKPLRWALEQEFKNHPHYYSRILFLFTDGEVGNEREIYDLLDEYEDENVRIFPFGIDTAVNEAFIRGLAKHGKGSPEFVYPGERIENKLMRQFDRILNEGMDRMEFVLPEGYDFEFAAQLPNTMYLGELIQIPFRVHHIGERPGSITIRGMYGDYMPQMHTLTVDKGIKGDNDLLKKAFAKATITELEDQLDQTSGRRALGIEKEIVRTSIEAGILSTKTSLIAIYRRQNKLPGVPDTITVPVALPRMWVGHVEPEMNFSIALNNMEVVYCRNESMLATDTIETLIHDVIQLQHADGTIAGEIEKTILFIIAMRLVGKKHQATYRIPIQKAELAVDQTVLADRIIKNTKKPKELLNDILN
jgi:Ca-activated chloride channel family protein